ncbi:ECF transporter S component [Clostridium taeniosporum]|uniref:ECF transporter S component n=1 Tax=Clostridium taeniosporum TaxID=394958 RepID=A0A1D7XLI4_9CLOT|nr:ECF transporter S component [Clostridium taeniosporum]AOR24196.1 ECF transporter S component [Clostridium taeniosporum]
MNNKIRKMVYTALLTALAIIIPIQFGFLRIVIPPFTATLASHVPMMLSMLISPAVAIVVGIGSTLGFLISGLPMVVVFRAATHIIVGYVGAKIIMKNRNYMKATIITAPIHGIAEMIVVIPFIGLNLFQLLIVTAVGTIIHHFIDSAIAYSLVKAMSKTKKTDIYHVFGDFFEDKDIQAQS